MKLEPQGVLALSNCSIGGGSFCCIPGFHKEWRQWCIKNSDKRVPPSITFVRFKDKEMIKSRLIEVPVEAGDFVIWTLLLPHTGEINKSGKWRLAQYIRYVHANPQNENIR